MGVKILVTGSTGQLGTEFIKELSPAYEISGISRKDADVTNYQQVVKAINKVEPHVVIHTAAMTDVDLCEKEQDLAMQVNASGARNVAKAAQKCGAAFIHFSTDYVFDGTKESAYLESDRPNPISHYGFTKLTGEKGVMEFHDNWTIIRTGWVYSPYRKNFVKSIVSAAKKKRQGLKVVDDQFGCPTWTRDIVRQTVKIIESGESGLFHAAAGGEMSRFEFAKTILQKLMPDTKVEPCATSEFPRPAKRPPRSTLKSERLARMGINVMRPINDSLNEFLTEYGAQLLNEVPD